MARLMVWPLAPEVAFSSARPRRPLYIQHTYGARLIRAYQALCGNSAAVLETYPGADGAGHGILAQHPGYRQAAIAKAVAAGLNSTQPIPCTPSCAGVIPLIPVSQPGCASTGAGSSVTLASSQDPSTQGQTVTLTAAVTCPSITPCGTVTFTFDGTVRTPVTLSSRIATFTTSNLAVGSHSVACQRDEL
jgi:hypothetical protein